MLSIPIWKSQFPLSRVSSLWPRGPLTRQSSYIREWERGGGGLDRAWRYSVQGVSFAAPLHTLSGILSLYSWSGDLQTKELSSFNVRMIVSLVHFSGIGLHVHVEGVRRMYDVKKRQKNIVRRETKEFFCSFLFVCLMSCLRLKSALSFLASRRCGIGGWLRLPVVRTYALVLLHMRIRQPNKKIFRRWKTVGHVVDEFEKRRIFSITKTAQSIHFILVFGNVIKEIEFLSSLHMPYMPSYALHVLIYLTCLHMLHMSSYALRVFIYLTCLYMPCVSLYTLHAFICLTYFYITYISSYALNIFICLTCL